MKKGHIRVKAAGVAALLALTMAAAPAAACSCQKEYMIKKHGTLNGLSEAAPPAPAPATPAPAPVPAPAEGNG